MSDDAHAPTAETDFAVLPQHLAATAEYASAILAAMPERPTAGDPASVRPPQMPTEPLGLAGALRLFEEQIAPGLHASPGPRYWGFVTGGTTPAALAGDWLTSAFDNNATSGTSLLAKLERQVLEQLAENLSLGTGLHGSFVTGATMSNFVNLAVAREWAGQRLGVSVAEEGLDGRTDGIRILSGSPHSSVVKSLAQLGFGRARMELIPTLPGREAVDPSALRRALAAAPDRPTIIVGSAGTVNTVDFDDLHALADLRDEFDAWLHIDGAFGAFAALSPDHASLTAGIDRADSVTLDLHKWLNVPYDSAVQYTRHPELQLQTFRNSAAYLGEIGDRPDFVHLTPENSRRARVLPAWFTLAAYGKAGLAAVVQRNIAQAHRFGAGVEQLPDARQIAPVRLNVACFTTEQDPASVLAALDARGQVFMTPSVLDGVPCIRAAFSNWSTTDADVDLGLRELAEVLATG